MNLNMRGLVVGLTLLAGGLLMGRGDAGGDKGAWQPILPKGIYQELAKREADIIRDLLNGKVNDQAVSRAKFGAVLLAAMTMSVKDGVPAEELRGTRETALQLAAALNKKDQITAKKLAATLPNGKADPNNKMAAVIWKSYLQPADLMDHYRVKKKGGDGMHPDLQSNARLKDALNSVEEKIHALAKKELTADGMKKEAKELELLGYHSAVVGALTYHYVPTATKDKKSPQEWQPLSVKMRDLSVSLAQAAQKGDAAAVYQVSGNLDSTCMQCHTAFRH